MLVRKLLRGVVASVVILAGCGSVADPDGPTADENSVTTSAPSSSTEAASGSTETAGPEVADDPADESVPPTAASSDTVDPMQVNWLAPADGVAGLDLVTSDRYLSAECGPASDCGPYLPAAHLRYQAPSGEAELTIDQRFPTSLLDTPTLTGDMSSIEIEGQAWTVATSAWGGALITVEAVSTDPDGVVTFVRSTGRQALDVDAVLSSLTATLPVEWPTPDRQPYTAEELASLQDRCVDDDSRWAPAFVPPGWTRFVLDAQPDGSCAAGSFLWLSLARPPAPDEEQGALVGFFVEASYGLDPGPGREAMIGDLSVRINEGLSGPSGPETQIVAFVGDVQIRVRGTADLATLETILSSIELLDADQWASFIATPEVAAATT